MTLQEIDEAQSDEIFSKWVINYEVSSFSDLDKLIEFELSTFDVWQKDFSDREKEFLKAQEELKNKSQLTSDEKLFLRWIVLI